MRKITVTVNHMLDVDDGGASAREIARQWFYRQERPTDLSVNGAAVKSGGAYVVSVTESIDGGRRHAA